MGTPLTEILNHRPKSQMGIIMRRWVRHNSMTEFSSLLSYTADKFTPTGALCHYKEKVDSEMLLMMPTTPLRNFRSCV